MKAGAPLIIFPTTGGSILKKMKSVCKKFKIEHSIDVKVYERGGLKIGNIAKSDPLSPSTCGKEDCFPCTSGGGGDCRKSCSAYRLECEECEKNDQKAVYEGETGRSCYCRGLEHVARLSKEKDDCSIIFMYLILYFDLCDMYILVQLCRYGLLQSSDL